MSARMAVAFGLAAAALAAAEGVGAQEDGSTVEPVEALEAWGGLDGGGRGPMAAEGTETGEGSGESAEPPLTEAAETAEPAADESETGERAAVETETAGPRAAGDAGGAPVEAPGGRAGGAATGAFMDGWSGAAGSATEPAGAGDGGVVRPSAAEGVFEGGRPGFSGSEGDPAAPALDAAVPAAEESVPVPPSGAGRQGAAPALPAPAPSPPVAEVPEPRGSLWRLLDARAERAAGETAAAYVADMAREGCPRDLLGLLLGSATDAREALTAVGLEREILELCRRRQEAVAAVLEREAELRGIVREMRTAGTGGVASEPEDWAAAIEAVPQLGLPGDAGGAAEEEESEEDDAPAPAAAAPGPRAPIAPPPLPLPPYRWFTLAGSPGALRAGGTDGTGVWFVSEGDALPGETWVAEITADPPAVRVAGASAGALPWGAPP